MIRPHVRTYGVLSQGVIGPSFKRLAKDSSSKGKAKEGASASPFDESTAIP